jgi:hypothetical protein
MFVLLLFVQLVHFSLKQLVNVNNVLQDFTKAKLDEQLVLNVQRERLLKRVLQCAQLVSLVIMQADMHNLLVQCVRLEDTQHKLVQFHAICV